MALAEKVELTFDAGICEEESACSISGTPAAEFYLVLILLLLNSVILNHSRCYLDQS